MSAWYLMTGGRTEGPVEGQELLQRVGTGEISPALFVWKEGEGDWKRIYEFSEFQDALPQKPSSEILENLKQSLAAEKESDANPESVRQWYAYIKGSQEGPYDIQEVAQLIKAGAINSETYIWKVGMDNWAFLKDLSEFSEAAAAAPKPPAPESESDAGAERRSSPRKPVVARVLFHDDSLLGQGICRDVSVGGAQILFDTSTKGSETPGVKAGDVLHMNVHGGDDFSPFTAEAEVVRILKGNQGFAVRFRELSDKSRQAVEIILKG